MNGTDHQMPQPWLGRVVAEANERQRDYEFVVTSLAGYLAEQPVDDLRTVAGELRSGARANLLMGVGSNRVDVHRACAAAERAVERRGEPLSALFLPTDRYPDALSAVAWRNLVCNSAHDSSCACSADEVVDQVVVRYAEARQIGDGMTHDAVAALAAQVVGRAGRNGGREPDRTGAHRARRDHRPGRGHGPSPSTPMVGPDRPKSSTGSSATPTRLWSPARRCVGCSICSAAPSSPAARSPGSRSRIPPTTTACTTSRLREAAPGEQTIDVGEVRERLLALGDAGATARRAPHRRAGAAACCSRPARSRDSAGRPTVCSTPAHTPTSGCRPTGWRTSTCASRSMRTRARTRSRPPTGCAYRVSAGWSTAVTAATRTTTPRPRPIGSSTRRNACVVTPLETGPVRRRVRIDADYTWPADAIGDFRSCSARSDETVARRRCTPRSSYGRANDSSASTHELDNQARDHRLRAHFPLPARVTGSDAECAFAVVHRGLTAEGGPQEVRPADVPVATVRRRVRRHGGARAPARRAARVRGGRRRPRARAHAAPVGRLPLAFRAVAAARAGRSDRPGRGRADARQASASTTRCMLHAGDWRAADCYGAADALLVPFERARASGGSDTDARGYRCGVARRRRRGLGRAARARPARRPRLPHRRRPRPGQRSSTRARPRAVGSSTSAATAVAPFDGSVELGPWEICTVVLNEPASLLRDYPAVLTPVRLSG